MTTINEQHAIYWHQITTRKRSPIKQSTLTTYDSYWRNWIQPTIGQLDVSQVENGVMKRLVAKLSTAGLAPATIAGVTNCVKEIVSSAIDENGNELYVRKWNSEFVDAPIVNPKDQKTPIIGATAVTEAIKEGGSEYGPLFALLASTGVRISEALAIRKGSNPNYSYWDPEQAIVSIKTQMYRGHEQSPKTASGTRQIDLSPEFNEYLKRAFPNGTDLLFPKSVRTLYDVAQRCGIPGFHAFRRFRLTHLENMGVPQGLAKYWSGHSESGVHSRYIKLNKDVQARKDWVIKAGLGFSLPKET